MSDERKKIEDEEFKELIKVFVDYFEIEDNFGKHMVFIPKGLIEKVGTRNILRANDIELGAMFASYLQIYSAITPEDSFKEMRAVTGKDIYQIFEKMEIMNFNYELTPIGSRILRRIAYKVELHKSRAA